MNKSQDKLANSMTNIDFLKESWHNSWIIPARLNPWRWAEENISFSTLVSPLPGRYSTNSTPYVRAVLEAAADPHTRHITMCWSAQSSKTTTALIMMYYGIACDPGNILLVRPSLQAAKSLSENKIQVVINENKALSCHKTSDKDDFTKTAMKLKNMVVFIRGASANQLSAESCKLVILDETDKYEEYKEDKAEADLVSLAYERTKYYKNHLKVDTSTPTIPQGRIWQLYHEGDMCLFNVPCPECGAFFAFEQDYFKFEKEDPKNTAYMECPHCNQAIFETSKYNMMQKGFWKSQKSEGDKDHRSFRLPEFYSPITRWGELADKFLKATAKAKLGDFGQLHNYINSSLAQPWDNEQNASRNVDQLIALQDFTRPEGVVPDGAIGLTIGIDTQGSYFECTIRAWLPEDAGSGLVLHKVLPDWESIVTIMNAEFPSQDGTKIYKISGGLIDSGGDKTHEVYDFCRKNKNLRLKPSKGLRTQAGRIEYTRLDKYPNGKPMNNGLKLVKVNTTYWKDLLAGKISLLVDEAGAFKLHANVDENYLKHMVAEYRNSKGIWTCPKHKKNESWDTEVLSLVVFDMLGMKFLPIGHGAIQPKDENAPVAQHVPVVKQKKKPRYTENPYSRGIHEH